MKPRRSIFQNRLSRYESRPTYYTREKKMRFYTLIVFVLILGLAFISTVLADDFTTDFETADLTGWTKTGDAFDFQPTKGDNPTARGRG